MKSSNINKAANAIPRWPFTINRQSDQARGLVVWCPNGRNSLVSSPDSFVSATGVYGAAVSDGPFRTSIEALYSQTGGVTYYDFSTTVNLSSNVPLTISCFAQVYTVQNGVVLYVGDLASWNDASYLQFSNTGIASAVSASGGGTFASADGTSNMGTQWHLITAVWETASSRKIYVDGQLEGTNTTNVASGTPDLVRFGAARDAGTQYVGALSDIRIYNRALSAPEVWALYDPATRYELYQGTRRTYFLPSTTPATTNAGGEVLSVIKRPITSVPHWPFTINRQSEQASGLLAWWPGNGNGNALADLSNKYALTRSQSEVWAGRPEGGTALTIPASSGTQQFVSLPANSDSVFNAYPMTLAFWLFVPANPAGNDALIGKYNWGSGTDGHFLYVDTSGDVHTWYFGASGNIYDGANGDTVVSSVANRWVHIAFAVGSNGGTWFANGVQTGSRSWSGTPSASTQTEPFIVGGNDGGVGNTKYAKRFADIRFYSRALSAFEVWALYDPATRYELYQPVHSRLYFAPIAGANTRVSDFNIAIGAV